MSGSSLNMNTLKTKPSRFSFANSSLRIISDPNQQAKIVDPASRSCSNSAFECTLPRVDGFEHCIKHILQNPRAPYKQCSFQYPNGKKCTEAAPKHQTKKDIGITTFCLEHSRLSQLTRLRGSVGKHKAIQTPETILADLSKFVRVDRYRGSVKEEQGEVASIDPFEDLDVLSPERKRSILDFASDSEEEELPTLANTARNVELDNSDNESVDSQLDDPLKHAGSYTADEVVSVTKEKLKKLQGLYMDQFARLQHVLREKRRKYLQDLKREKESLSCIYNQPLNTPQERILYSKLKAMNHYHRKTGVHAILHKRLQEKRAKATEGFVQKPIYYHKCIFTEGGVKCGERALPGAKHCRKHILEDKKQVLFKACGVEKSNVVCQEVITKVFENATCVLHMPVPQKKKYVHKKYQSDTDEEEMAVKEETKEEKVAPEPMETSVKTEELDISDFDPSEVSQVVDIDPAKLYDTIESIGTI